MALDTTTRQRLLVLARTALEAYIAREAAPRVPGDLRVDGFGVFVTVKVDGELRGCLGALDCAGSIPSEIVRLSAAVATDDYRFAPLARGELTSATLDLSVLTPPEPVLDRSTIEVGRHGLIVEQGRYRGLLLPQVAEEHGWDRETFLMHTCLKAGLPAGAWQQGASVLQFEAEVFGERVT